MFVKQKVLLDRLRANLKDLTALTYSWDNNRRIVNVQIHLNITRSLCFSSSQNYKRQTYGQYILAKNTAVLYISFTMAAYFPYTIAIDVIILLLSNKPSFADNKFSKQQSLGHIIKKANVTTQYRTIRYLGNWLTHTQCLIRKDNNL